MVERKTTSLHSSLSLRLLSGPLESVGPANGGYGVDNFDKKEKRRRKTGRYINTEAARRRESLARRRPRAPSLRVSPRRVWQLADDNRWRELITSSWHKTNPYPGASTRPFRRRGDAGGRRRRRRRKQPKGSSAGLGFFISPSQPPPIHLPDAYAKPRRIRAAPRFTFAGQRAGVLI